MRRKRKTELQKLVDVLIVLTLKEGKIKNTPAMIELLRVVCSSTTVYKRINRLRLKKRVRRIRKQRSLGRGQGSSPQLWRK